jgi:hypothetical protein
MKHGLNARVATYFPAKPDGYAFCERCDVDRTWCYEQPACVKQTELFMLHHAAFEQRDPKVLGRVHSDIHAALVATLQLCLQQVLAVGCCVLLVLARASSRGAYGTPGLFLRAVLPHLFLLLLQARPSRGHCT